MKKIFLPVLLLISTFSFAQVCVPGTITVPGKGYIIPDAALNFNDACVGQNYLQYVYIKVPKDTTVSLFGVNIPATIDSFVIKRAVTGLPAGLTAETVPNFLAAAPSNPKTNFERLVVKGDSLACIKISGIVPTGTALGANNLSINVRAYLRAGLAIDTAMDINYYVINVKANNCFPASISNLDKYSFDLIGNAPNPFTGNTTISFQSAVSKNFDLKIMSATGAIVYAEKVKSQIGMNYINIDGSKLSSGMYMILLNDDKNRLTKKMQVK
jgi:hypothetical protein